MTDDMNRAEIALLWSLGLATQVHAQRIVTDLNYAAATPEQQLAITQHIEDCLTDVIVGMRDPGPHTTPAELGELMRMVAMGAVSIVLGDPPAPEVLH